MVRMFHKFQLDSRVLSTFVPNESFGQLLNISLTNHIYRERFHSEFSYFEVWFADQNFKPSEMEDKINLTLVTNDGEYNKIFN